MHVWLSLVKPAKEACWRGEAELAGRQAGTHHPSPQEIKVNNQDLTSCPPNRAQTALITKSPRPGLRECVVRAPMTRLDQFKTCAEPQMDNSVDCLTIMSPGLTFNMHAMTC